MIDNFTYIRQIVLYTKDNLFYAFIQKIKIKKMSFFIWKFTSNFANEFPNFSNKIVI